jgi:redox-sensitive bicupin YhaK (pirin superfamily)
MDDGQTRDHARGNAAGSPGRDRRIPTLVNLPAKLEMSRPRYQEIRAADIPELAQAGGVKIRVITGTVDRVGGPVTGIAAAATYPDVSLPAHASFSQPIERGHAAFAYVFEGGGTIYRRGANTPNWGVAPQARRVAL